MKKILYRSKKNRVVGGVCGGIGEYFDIDPTLIRLLAILTFFFGGSGVIAYIIGWIIIPQNPSENTEQHFKSEQKIVDMEEVPKASESKFKTTEEYQSVENGKNNLHGIDLHGNYIVPLVFLDSLEHLLAGDFNHCRISDNDSSHIE